jgi:hypothetical protein
VRVKPNWPLVAILAGAIATIAVIVAMFTGSDSMSSRGLPLPTTEHVDGVDASDARNSESQGSLALAPNGCIYLDWGDGGALAVWPDGYLLDGDDVVSSRGDRFEPGATIEGDFFVVDRAVVAAGSDQALNDTLELCAPDSPEVIIISDIR